MGLRHLKIWAAMLAVSAIIAYAANPVYVAAGTGLYKSTDAGVTWNNVNIPLNNPLLSGSLTAYSLSKDPNHPSKIYLIGHATAWAFFASPDAGQTWSATPFIGMTPKRVAVDFAGNVIYVTASTTASSGDPLLYKSTDVGATWTQLRLPNTPTTPASRYPFGSSVIMFVPDPLVSGTIHALTNGDEFFKSTDFGTTWTKVSGPGVTDTSGTVVPQTIILNIHVDPRNALTWYFGTDHGSFPATCPLTNGGLCGLFKSTDGAATFTGLNIPVNYVSSVSFGAVSETVYATGDVAGLGPTVMRTTNGGSTWTPLKNGLFSSRGGRIWADPTDESTIYVNDNASNHDFHVSTDGGATFPQRAIPTGPPGCIPGACGQQDINDLLIAPAVAPPTISAVVNGADLHPGFSPNSWVTIFGTNLASQTGDWSSAFVNGALPTTVNGTSVSMGGKPAYVYFTSQGQLNVLAPDISPGPVSVTVTNAGGTSGPFTATGSVYGPAFFSWPDNQVVATRQDFSYAVKPGTFAGVTTVAARPGDVIILWATGFGPTTPDVTHGFAVPADRTYAAATPTVTLNNTSVTVYGAALTPGVVGVYQVAIQVPSTLADGDYSLQATTGGVQSSPGIVLPVRR